MKKSFTFFILVTGIFLFSCDNQNNTLKKEMTTEIEKQVVEGDENKGEAKIQIEGMTCPMGCAKTIEKKLKLTDGVLSAEVNFDEKTAFVNYNPQEVSEKDLIQVIENIADGQYKAIKAEVKEVKKTSSSSQQQSHQHQDKEGTMEQSFTLYIPDIFSSILRFYSL